MKEITLLIMVAFGLINTVSSQTISPELVSSAGDSFKNSTYQLSWSVGECVTATHKAGNYVLTQGLHQNSYIVMAIRNLRADIVLSVYPNPTSDFISLKTESARTEDMQYTVSDFSGRALQTAEIKRNLEQINFSNYAVGTYFIIVSQNNQLIKSFKIIKK